MLRIDALKIAREAIETLKPHCHRIEIGGSIRRELETVKDIELICIPKRITTLRRKTSFINAVLSLGSIEKGRDINKAKYIQIHTGKIKIDLFPVDPENFGMTYLIRTGPAEYSRRIFTLFNKLGYQSKDGIHKHHRTGETVTFKEEKEIFDFLNIHYVEPKRRYN